MSNITIKEALQKSMQATRTYVDKQIADLQLDIENDLNEYAKTSDLHSHSNKTVLDGITSDKVSAWDAKSNFSGSYDDLTNKPTIPTVTNDLTNDLKAEYDAAYAHSQEAHAPANAQKNSDITKAEIEAKLIGTITSHDHSGTYAAESHTHDDRYYTESEINTKVSTLEDAISTAQSAAQTYADNKITALVDSAPDAMNTLNELATAINDHQDVYDAYVAEVSTALSKKADASHGNHVPTTQTADNTVFLRNDNTWATVTPANIGAAASNHGTHLSLGTTDSTAFRGDQGLIAYNHSQEAHAPSTAQANADITKEEIEAKLTGDISTHTHSQYLTEHQDLSDYALQSDLHEHSNKDSLDTITEDAITKWNQALPFDDTYVSDCNTWLTNGYIKTSTSTSNHPSVCTGADRWGILFFIAENVTQGTGTQMYFPIDGTYKGRVFVRSLTNMSAAGSSVGDWNLLSTFDGDYNSLTNIPEGQDLSSYAKTADLAAVATSGSYNDLSNTPTIPTTTSQLTNDSGYITSVPSEYITETELTAKGYLTEHQDLSAYALTSSVPTKTSQLTNDSGYITSVPSEYVTESELTAKGYATTSQIPTTLPASGGNADTVDNIHIVQITKSEYEALSTKDANTLYLITG